MALGLGQGGCSPSGSRTHGLVPALHGAGQVGPISEWFCRPHPPQSAWWGLLQNFPEHLKSPLLGQGCQSSRAPPSWAFILRDRPVQSAWLDGNGHRTPTLAASSTPPSTKRSLLPSSFTRHRCPSLCLGAADSLPQKDPCPPPRQPPDAPGHSPCVPALLCRPVLYGPPSLRAPGHLPAQLDSKAQSTGQLPSTEQRAPKHGDLNT